MLNLLLSTLGMMGLTFGIGFFVAGIIKAIANWADLFAFYKLHQLEILSLKKTSRPLEKTVPGFVAMPKNDIYKEKHRKVSHFLNETFHSLKPRRRITA